MITKYCCSIWFVAILTPCDGSVRAISENIDASLYNALGTRSGGEVVGEF